MDNRGMFELLIADEYDIIGQIAYALYKERKRDFIIQQRLLLGVNEISEESIKTFVESQKTEFVCKKYRELAENISADFLAVGLQEVERELDAEYRQKYEKLARSWWYGVTQSLAASFIFVSIGALILKFSGVWDIIASKIF